MTKTIFAAALIASLAMPTLAFADDDQRCAGVAAGAWLSVEQISAKATEAGYTVREVERDDGCYDIDATDASGKQMDIRMHPGTGAIIETDIDD